MDFYRIIGCRSNNGSDWRVLDYLYCNKINAIHRAKEFYSTDEWSNIAVELDNDTEIATNILWDAGHDKISNFTWD